MGKITIAYDATDRQPVDTSDDDWYYRTPVNTGTVTINNVTDHTSTHQTSTSAGHTSTSTGHSSHSPDKINQSNDHARSVTGQTSRSTDHTSRTTDHTSRTTGQTSRSTDHTSRSTDHTSRTTDHTASKNSDPATDHNSPSFDNFEPIFDCLPTNDTPTSSSSSTVIEEEGQEELREACGVFGCVLVDSSTARDGLLARTIMDALVALQHRGQESAGIVTSDGRGCKQFKHHRALGLVSSVFTQEKLATLTGSLGLGHTRYSTAGGGDISNTQPFMVHTRHGMLAIAHNGELINADTLRKTVLERGVGLSTRSDSELITQILSLTPLRGEHRGEADWQARIRHLVEATPTSYSLGVMNEDKIYGVRDPFGNRPLCVGLLRELDAEGIGLADGVQSKVLGYVLSSESCAFPSIGATFLREVMPGEIVELSSRGVRRVDRVHRPQTVMRSPNEEHHDDVIDTNGSGSAPNGGDASSPSIDDVTNGTVAFLHDIENVPSAFCIFEYVYFARPDSYFEGQQVYSVRERCGRKLALESPVDVDIVSCVPESATPAARGYASQLDLPYVDVLHKSRYVGRTFIQPCVGTRKRSVARKFAAITENVRGRRVVLVDDSVVRGTTIQPIVKLIRDAGAKEVHFRVASPPIRHPCYMGINIPTRAELVANKMPLEDLAAHFGVDSLRYLTIGGLEASVREGANDKPGEAMGHCTACLSGRYPVNKDWC